MDALLAFWFEHPVWLLMIFFTVVAIVLSRRPKKREALFWIIFLFVIATPVVWAVITNSGAVADSTHRVPPQK